jgi:acetyl-CoA carboxylase biotin carboxyl carrier protein
MSLSHDDVTKILKIIDSMEGRDVHVELGDLKIHVNRSGRPLAASIAAAAAAPASAAATAPSSVPAVAGPATPSPAAAAAAPETPVPAGHVAIRAPMMGTFYRAPSPGAAAFVEVGTKVSAQETVCLLEVMKLFNSIKAGVAGTVAEIRAPNAGLVQRDTILIVIRPDA